MVDDQEEAMAKCEPWGLEAASMAARVLVRLGISRLLADAAVLSANSVLT